MNHPPNSQPPAPHDTPTNLTRQIMAAYQQLRHDIQTDLDTGNGNRATKRITELTRLIELRLRIAGETGHVNAAPDQGPGRPPHAPEGPSTPLYDVAERLRAALLDLDPDDQRDAAQILADVFPALLAEPLEPEPRRTPPPPHLKPPPEAPPRWVRQNWQG